MINEYLEGKKKLDTKMLINSVVAQDPIFDTVRFALIELTKKFMFSIYLRGLRDIIEESDKSGMTGVFDNVTINSYVMAGRVMLTVLNENAQITFMAAEGEDNPMMGWHSLEGFYPDIQFLIDNLVKNWNSDKNYLLKNYLNDEEISISC